MSNILNIPSQNSYLTSKQWSEVIEYVKNKKNVMDNPLITENNKEVVEPFVEATHSEAYKQMVQTTSVSDMYMALLSIMNENPQQLYEISEDELQTLYDTANRMNEESPSEDYTDLADTLQYLAGEYDLNGAVAYADWNGTSGSGSYNISGTITISSVINITSGNTLTLTGSGIIKRGSGSGYFYVQDGGTLVIKGTDKDNNIIIDGDNITSSYAAIRAHKNLTLENVIIKNCIRTSGMGGAIQYGYDGYTKLLIVHSLMLRLMVVRRQKAALLCSKTIAAVQLALKIAL